MSSISQSVLMALAVTVNKFASSNVHAVQRKESKTSPATSPAAFPRRGFLLSTLVAAYPLTTDSKTQLLNKYLKKSEENKAKNDKEKDL
ncbi:hypothetical protein MANES_07G054000v8 [Manihot esculenta]|uniref:Uncharacterized protein n=1 Tax=Manihot esculenta TaxID=3983 RepID=A0ACB7HEC1_MANES|nr:hypothetical protein MANES_07G054000v8 [Manihot esculenta]